MLALLQEVDYKNILKDEHFRRVHYLGRDLRLPTFEKFRKVTYIDTLQTLCMRYNIWNYH